MASTPTQAPSPAPSSERDPTPEPARIDGDLPLTFMRRSAVEERGPGLIRLAWCIGGEVQEASDAEALTAIPDRLKRGDAFLWVDLIGPTREQVEAVGAALGLHPLIVEDVLEGNQRAKIETTDGVVHIVLFHLDYDAALIASEVDIVLGDRFLLTAHDHTWDPREGNHMRGGIGPILKSGPDHLLWALADDIIDGYFPFADRLGDAIDDVQDAVVRNADKETLERLFFLKRELISVRRAISPVREVFNQLTNRDTPLIDEGEIVYFRDIYDHVIRLTDELDNYRELASATLDVYLTTINNNLSVIMKRLTGVTVILAGIGAVAGIFGMSEASNALGGGEASGFWLVTGITIGIAMIAALVLRHIDWI